MAKSWELVERYDKLSDALSIPTEKLQPIVVERQWENRPVMQTIVTGTVVKQPITFRMAAREAHNLNVAIERATHARNEWRNDGACRFVPPAKKPLAANVRVSTPASELPVKCDWAIEATIERWKRARKK